MEYGDNNNDYSEDTEFSKDVQIQELQSCKLVFSHLNVDYKLRKGSIEIPLAFDNGGKILQVRQNDTILASKEVNNLIPIVFEFSLPEDYPYDVPPVIKLQNDVISMEKRSEIIKEMVNIWEDLKDQSLFSMIDYLLCQTQDHIDEIVPSPLIINDLDIYNRCLDYDKKCKVDKFNSKTYACDICQSDFKGSKCIQFEKCLHVFCLNCLTEYFTSSITQGDIDKIHCPDFQCTKDYLKRKQEFMDIDSWKYGNQKVKDIITTFLTPVISIEKMDKILNDQSLIRRYQDLFKKQQYEAISKVLPNRLVRCPGLNCEEIIFREDLNDRLVRCPACKYAFCNDCKKSYHTRFKLCQKATENMKYFGIPIEDLENYKLYPSDSLEKRILNAKYGRSCIAKAINEFEMDQLFEAMLKESINVKQCPGCETVIEKFEGCNRMKCSKCGSFFCFHCGEMISSDYSHFSDTTSPCYKLLFFGMIIEGNEQT
ncbi:unnamed protein product [Candida verbasci]|uniref:RBR-type E3 ubiquitin transferase n=1 Tax=Candida verbasci TaxID=1227364 RepID=A0A9W4TVT9_9ASCO|nr:unnamed protein product [Candida verbasci]